MMFHRQPLQHATTTASPSPERPPSDVWSRLDQSVCLARPLYRHLRRYAAARGGALRVLDVATGCGQLPIHWACRAAADRLDLQITGIDSHPKAIEQARCGAANAGVDVRFVCTDCLAPRFSGSFDVVTCTEFIHHLDEAPIRRLLLAMRVAAEQAVLVCDLQRSRTNLAAAWLASHILPGGPDPETACREVCTALTGEEFCRLAYETLGQPITVRRLPPCRFLAVIEGAALRVDQPLLAQALQPT